MRRARLHARHRWVVAAALLLAAAPALAARDVMLVLDNSGSMRRNDPQRLATPAVKQFIRGQPRDTRVGIVLFDVSPRLAMPLTPAEVAADGDAARALERFDYAGRRTQTAGAVERALYELRAEGRSGAEHAIVLMTDGLIDSGDAARDAQLDKWLRQDLAAQARRDGVRIFGIAFTEQADYELLQSLAATTGAQYFRVLSPAGIARALEGIDAVLSGAPASRAPAPSPAAPRAPAAGPAPQAAPARRDVLGWLAATAAAVLLAVAAGAWLRRRRGAGETTGRIRVQRDSGPAGVLYDSVERHELGARPVVIGRAGGSDPNNYYIVLSEKTVGRWHATIERRGQTFWVRDEGSVNGTFINDERVIGERPLKHRDTLRIHNHRFEFEIPELADADRTVMQPRPGLPLN